MKQSKHRRFILGLLVVSVATSLLNVGQVNAAEKSNIRLVAVGDSLTEGIGDTTKQQGYTKRTAKLLTKAYGVRVK
ncbi:hydrolase, partial [Lactobacillaceae bacterium KNUT 0156]|nr:hydrolase [Weissella cibaria]